MHFRILGCYAVAIQIRLRVLIFVTSLSFYAHIAIETAVQRRGAMAAKHSCIYIQYTYI